jgi:hypothetical protein
MNKFINNSSAKSVSKRKYRRPNRETGIDSEDGRALTPAFEVNNLSQSAFQRLIHWHESYAQALGPKAMNDSQARAEQLTHRKWVHLLIMAALRAGQNESVGKDGRTATDDLRSAPDVELHYGKKLGTIVDCRYNAGVLGFRGITWRCIMRIKNENLEFNCFRG